MNRDDGLCVIKASPQSIEKTKKSLCSIFSKQGLRITVEANSKIVNYLDITLNLNTGKFAPYQKPNNVPLYVNQQSNHPLRLSEAYPLV